MINDMQPRAYLTLESSWGGKRATLSGIVECEITNDRDYDDIYVASIYPVGKYLAAETHRFKGKFVPDEKGNAYTIRVEDDKIKTMKITKTATVQIKDNVTIEDIIDACERAGAPRSAVFTRIYSRDGGKDQIKFEWEESA